MQQFFKTYYAPNNAALAVVGDFDPTDARKLIEKYFANIPSVPKVTQPDLKEPRQEKEKRATKADALATRPALAFSYHAPPRDTPEYYAMGVLDEILVQGKDSRLYQALVQKNGFTGNVNGAINELGNMFDIKGPVLFTVSLFHDKDKSADQIMKVVDEEIEKLRYGNVTRVVLQTRRRYWEAEGLNFPGHFLIRVAIDGARHVIDPFNDGVVRNAVDLRELTKKVLGPTARPSPFLRA